MVCSFVGTLYIFISCEQFNVHLTFAEEIFWIICCQKLFRNEKINYLLCTCVQMKMLSWFQTTRSFSTQNGKLLIFYCWISQINFNRVLFVSLLTTLIRPKYIYIYNLLFHLWWNGKSKKHLPGKREKKEEKFNEFVVVVECNK